VKHDIHPGYGWVLFRDASADFAFLTRSTLSADNAGGPGRPEKTVDWTDGTTYPVIDVEISSASHPFSTGTARVVDSAGRVEKFNRRYGRQERSTR